MIYLEISGKKYEGFNSASISLSMETLCGRFDISATSEKGSSFPIKRMDQVKIYIDDTQIIDGYVDTISPKGSASTHSILVSGRDRTSDLVDSNLPVRSFSENTTIEKIAKKILSDLNEIGSHGISVINSVGPLYLIADSQAAELEETIFMFLRRLAYKSNVLLNTDGKGNIVISTNNQEKIQTKILNQIVPSTYDSKFLNKNNVLEYDCKYDDSKRFYKYITESQASGDLNIDNLSEAGIESKQVLDTLVRKSRFKSIAFSGNADIDFLNKTNEWEASNRKAKSLLYTATVAGHYIDEAKSQLWSINKIVHVIDDFCEIDQDLLIYELTYVFDLQNGSKTIITCLPSDAYLQKPPVEDDNVGGLLA